jgi:hypothetical protein
MVEVQYGGLVYLHLILIDQVTLFTETTA